MIRSVFSYVQGLISLRGATDNTLIGNIGDRLKVDSNVTIIGDSTGNSPNVIKQAELTVATRVQSDIADTIYTVPAGKKFKLSWFGGSYDNQGGVYIRLKRQPVGTVGFVTVLRVTIKQQPQEESTQGINLPMGLVLGNAGDTFKITYETALAKGTLWAGFVGSEY